MNQWQQDVRQFHEAFGATVNERPTVPGIEVEALRKRLVAEEAEELADAMASGHLPSIAKEAADLIVVTLGTMVSYGIDLDPIWRAVHESNMAKLGGPVRADGKILKPPGWKAPDIAALIRAQESPQHGHTDEARARRPRGPGDCGVGGEGGEGA